MRNRLVRFANNRGMTGFKRMAFFAIAPLAYSLAYAIGFVKRAKKCY